MLRRCCRSPGAGSGARVFRVRLVNALLDGVVSRERDGSETVLYIEWVQQDGPTPYGSKLYGTGHMVRNLIQEGGLRVSSDRG